ncbi:MAG: hypothetical protein ACYC11_09590, partial [Bellilinea sp.]
MTAGQTDDFSQKSLVDLPEQVDGDVFEGVGAFGIIQVGQNILEDLIVDAQGGGEGVGVGGLAFFSGKVEEAGVVFSIGLIEEHEQVAVDILAVGGVTQGVFGFDAAVLADAQENDAVDGHLHGKIDVARGQARVAQGDIAGQVGAPALHFGQEIIVDVSGAALAFKGHRVAVEGTLMHRLMRKQVVDFIPFFGIIPVGIKVDPIIGGRIAVGRFFTAVIDRQLLEVAQKGDRDLGGPGVTADLKGGVRVGFDVDGWFFGFEEEEDAAAGLKGVVGGFGLPFDLDR